MGTVGEGDGDGEEMPGQEVLKHLVGSRRSE